jgi:hypothetical protein
MKITHRLTLVAALSFLLCAYAAGGQQWTTATNGTDIYAANNSASVGVGTTTPAYKFEVHGGDVYVTSPYPGSGLTPEPRRFFHETLNSSPSRTSGAGFETTWVRMADSDYRSNLGFYTSLDNVPLERLRIDFAGNVGIGTTGPTRKLDVLGTGRFTDVLTLEGLTAAAPTPRLNFGTYYANTGSSPGGPSHIVLYDSADKYGFGISAGMLDLWSGVGYRFNKYAGGTASSLNVVIDSYGRMAIGTETPDPSSSLTVAGNITVTGNINAKYQDLAEWTPASQPLAAATVVVLDPQYPRAVVPSAKAYDTRVAGVVSANPGIVLGEAAEGSVKVATTGRVKVHVDATSAPIEVGDLLVTSARPGAAMRSTPVNIGGIELHRPGTLIGKALEPLQEGEGDILVLLSLQ